MSKSETTLVSGTEKISKKTARAPYSCNNVTHYLCRYAGYSTAMAYHYRELKNFLKISQ